MTNETKPQEQLAEEPGYIDPAGLMFQGRVVIKDAETGEIIVDKRSE